MIIPTLQKNINIYDTLYDTIIRTHIIYMIQYHIIQEYSQFVHHVIYVCVLTFFTLQRRLVFAPSFLLLSHCHLNF